MICAIWYEFKFSLLLLLFSVCSVCQFVFTRVQSVAVMSPTTAVAGPASASMPVYAFFVNLD